MRIALRRIAERCFPAHFQEFDRRLSAVIGDHCASLLDVGCGFDSPIRRLPRRPVRLVGVDGFAPALEQSRALGIHDEYHHMGLLDIGKAFRPKSFECVVALDVIEHLTPEDGLRLLGQMELLATRQVIVFTPNGFLEQAEHYGNPLQKHLSGWAVAQMKDLGYEVTGIGGLSFLKGEIGRIRWHPRALWGAVSLLSQPWTAKRPQLAFSLFCVKPIADTAVVQESRRSLAA